MNRFATAFQETSSLKETENGSPSLKTSSDACVDFFFAVGALRGQGVDRLRRLFLDSVQEDLDLSIRIALWARDVRGGAGERQIFRDLLLILEQESRKEGPIREDKILDRVVDRVPEVGRWDDLLVFQTEEGRQLAFEKIKTGMTQKNGLVFKWLPRKGEVANDLRKRLGMTPKQYRKTLVRGTQVVESLMCEKRWDEIEFQKVPSLASARYAKAFSRHQPVRYKEYIDRVNSGEEKINVGAIYPYDVTKNAFTNPETAKAQWDSLPSFGDGESILPMIDVSGSMNTRAGNGKSSLTCMDVAISLGLFLAEKNRGEFRNKFLSFSGKPSLHSVSENSSLSEKILRIGKTDWGMNTDLDAAFLAILNLAKRSGATSEELPSVIVILSDMEFDRGFGGGSNRRVSERTRLEFKKEGFALPKIVWWNIQSRHDNVPVREGEDGMSLVSGFSPSIVESILSAKMMSPEIVMLEAVAKERYNF